MAKPFRSHTSSCSAPRSPRCGRALDCYQRQLGRQRLLTPNEETDLTRRFAATRDPALRHRLAAANLRLVAKLAFGYARRNRADVLDLIQEGNLGLLQAIERFDPERGVRLTTFAAWWIRAYLLRHLINGRGLVRIGTTGEQRRLFFGLDRVERQLERQGLPVTNERVAERLDSSVASVAEMRVRLAPDVPLHAPIRQTGDGRLRLQDVLPQEDDARPDVQVEAKEERDARRRLLRDFASRLVGREQVLFEERLVAEEPQTLTALARRFDLSRERMRQVELELIARLRSYLQEARPRPALPS